MTTEISTLKPSYLANVDATVDNSDMAAYSKPPRLKIIQSLTGPPLKPPFREGDGIIVPQSVKLFDGETPVTFVPIAFFPSWVCINPLQMKGQLPAVREYTLDPQSDVAKKCKSFTIEKCPENPQYELKYSETLNFMICIEDNPDWSGIPIHYFCSRGEYKTGQKLLALIQARKAVRYACRFRAVTSMHNGPRGNWFGMDIMNDPQVWVSEENFHAYKKAYEEFKKLIESRTLELDTADVESAVAETSEF